MSDSAGTTTDSTVQVIGFDVDGTNQEKRQPSDGHKFPVGSPLPVTIPPVLNSKETNGTPEEKSHLSDLTRQLTPRSKPPTSSKPRSQAKEATSGKKKLKGEKKMENLSTPCLALFDHLDQYKAFSKEEILQHPELISMDPHFVEFCFQYGENSVNESNACQKLLQVLSKSVESFDSEEMLFYTREYLSYFNHQIGFLVSCRALNISMRNAIRSLKVEISKLKSGIPLGEGKEAVKRIMDAFLEERVDVNSIIAKEAIDLIKDGDVILTYSSSETVFSVLSHAWKESKSHFQVMVVDSRPSLSGKSFLKRLSDLGIPCSYLMINAVSFALKEVSKVLLGASAVLSNGTVMAFTGSAAIASLAHEKHIPTVFCCQTLKFHERVQLDAFTHNELENPDHLRREEIPSSDQFLSLLNLKYDLTPACFVSVIITELGFVPATSVPVILREQTIDWDTPEFNE